MELSLTCRLTDKPSKHISRIFTPKPKKNPTNYNAFRPISLWYDHNAFICYIQQLLLTDIYEKADIFPSSLYTYHPGHSCSSIITICQAMLNDAIENDRIIIAVGSDDKDKYFNCITLEH